MLGVLPIHLRRLQGLTVQAQTVAQQGQLLCRENRLHLLAHRALRCGVFHTHQIFLVGGAVRADQLAGNAPVLRQHQQAGGVDIQPPGGRQPPQLARQKTHGAFVALPATGVAQQRGRAGIAVFGLAADVADRLVQQKRDLLLLLHVGGFVHVDAVCFLHAQAHFSRLAVHKHPAAADPVVCLAARAQPHIGHAFVEADACRRSICYLQFLRRRSGGCSRHK